MLGGGDESGGVVVYGRHGAVVGGGGWARAGDHPAEDELDHFAVVEVAAHEFAVGGEFFQCRDGEAVGFHYRVADGGNLFEDDVCNRRGGARKGLDEGDAVIGMELALVQPEGVEGHGMRSISPGQNWWL